MFQITENSEKNTNNSNGKNKVDIWYLILLIIVVFILQFGLGKIMDLLALKDNFLKLAVIIKLVLSILLPTILFLNYLRLRIRETLGLYRPPWIRSGLAIIFGFIGIIIVNIILPRIISPSSELLQLSGSISSYNNLHGFILSFITVTIFASVVDELFFRGILLQMIMQRYGKLFAVIITAVVTALFHKLEPFKLVHAFLMGLIFAISVVWTKSVYTSIILHSIHNSLALIPQG